MNNFFEEIGDLKRRLAVLERYAGSGGGGGVGDMLKSVYDTDNDGRVDAAESVSDGTNTKTAAQVKAAHDHISLTNNPHSTTSTQVATDTSLFNVLLSAADNTVQKALDTLDNHTHGWTYGSPIRNEVPTGSINGSNTAFSLANSPATGSVTLYLNGVRLKPTDDYSISGANITMVTAPATGDNFLADYSIGLSIEIGASSFVYNEPPSGSINSSNTSFTIANTPVTNTLMLFRDGQLMKAGAGNDYTLSGATITFATAPETGTILLACYQFAAVAAGNADTLDNYHANATPTANTIPVLDANGFMPNDSLGGAWTSTTPTPTPSVGAFTTVSCQMYHKQVGKTVLFNFSLTITANGTASGGIYIPLPVTGKRSGFGHCNGREVNTTGYTFTGTFATSTVILFKYDNSYPGGTGYILQGGGSYEAA